MVARAMKRRLGPIFNAANDTVEHALGKTSLAGLVLGQQSSSKCRSERNSSNGLFNKQKRPAMTTSDRKSRTRLLLVVVY